MQAAEKEGAPEPSDDSSRYSHPVWMVEKLRHNWPEDWQAILDANNTQAPMTLRVNALRFRREEYLDLLAEAGIEAKPTRFAPHGIQLARPVPVERLPWFEDGGASVQDEAAQLCTTMLDLQPGQRVWILRCSGGKTCAILEACGELDDVVAIDESMSACPGPGKPRPARPARYPDPGRCRRYRQLVGRQPFDRILLDICSAAGVIRGTRTSNCCAGPTLCPGQHPAWPARRHVVYPETGWSAGVCLLGVSQENHRIISDSSSSRNRQRWFR